MAIRAHIDRTLIRGMVVRAASSVRARARLFYVPDLQHPARAPRRYPDGGALPNSPQV
jgi:hypothetical protein